MYHRQPLPMAAIAATLLLRPPVPAQPEACSLLTVAQVSAALEVTSLPGRPPLPSAHSSCMWFDDSTGDINHRRVTLSLTPAMMFDRMKDSPQLKTEPVSGIGDAAYYELLGAESPALAVRKGGSAFTVRILNGLKSKPFAIAQVKAKEADLAKAAAAKL